MFLKIYLGITKRDIYIISTDIVDQRSVHVFGIQPSHTKAKQYLGQRRCH